MNSFTAVDVETANADFASICQIGIVRFEDGAIVDEWQSLVNPEDHFSGINVSIHGITESDAAMAPTLPALHSALTSKLCGLLVCHTSFDRISIARAHAKYGLPQPTSTWLDSARVARRAWPEQCSRRGYGLLHLGKMLAFQFTPHVAVEDAKAAGWIILRAIADTGRQLDDWMVRVEEPIFPIAQHSTLSAVANWEGPLAGETIVFTGALSMVRSEAAALAAVAGCDVQDGVTRRTTLLVVGDQDIRHLAGHEKSGKHRKAESLIDGGQHIWIVAERDFLALLALEGCAKS